MYVDWRHKSRISSCQVVLPILLSLLYNISCPPTSSSLASHLTLCTRRRLTGLCRRNASLLCIYITRGSYSNSIFYLATQWDHFAGGGGGNSDFVANAAERYRAPTFSRSADEITAASEQKVFRKNASTMAEVNLPTSRSTCRRYNMAL